jgi:hypothetical protein
VSGDPDANYIKEISIDLNEVFLSLLLPSWDNVKAISEVEGTPIQQALVGTCTNGRFDDLYEAAMILRQETAKGYANAGDPGFKRYYCKRLRRPDRNFHECRRQCPCIVLRSLSLGTGQGYQPTDIT